MKEHEDIDRTRWAVTNRENALTIAQALQECLRRESGRCLDIAKTTPRYERLMRAYSSAHFQATHHMGCTHDDILAMGK